MTAATDTPTREVFYTISDTSGHSVVIGPSRSDDGMVEVSFRAKDGREIEITSYEPRLAMLMGDAMVKAAEEVARGDTTKTHYVLGFLVYSDWVLLIKKQRPDWQKGYLNGVGGHVEPGETYIEALIREVREEVGIDTTPEQWRHFATLEGKDYRCMCYVGFSEKIWKAKVLTDEVPGLYRVHNLTEHALPSVRYLLPMALDPDLTTPVTLSYGWKCPERLDAEVKK